MGTKGDWPFLRHAYALNNSFNCKKKCHMCEMNEAGLHAMFPKQFCLEPFGLEHP